MATPKETVWDLEPHTGAKHSILNHYLKAWFPILNKYNSRIMYLDGFCGPGVYSKGEPGSPIIAIEVARTHGSALNAEIIFFFIDEEADRIENLKREIAKLTLPSHFKTYPQQGEFHEVLGRVLDDLDAKMQNLAPTFAFIDPFGFKGLPFDLVARLLRNPKCEVFITFMVDAINRFIDHPNEEIQKHIVELFGSKDVLRIISAGGDRISKLRIFYQKQLGSIARYVRYFEMRDSDDRPIYDLFFASNNDLGHLKMKQAMWTVDTEGFFRFSDMTDPQQEILFRENHAAKLYEILKEKFTGKKVPVKDLKKIVHDDTAYIDKHLSEALKYAEEHNLIIVDQVKSDGKKRKARTFPDEVLLTFK